VVEALALGQSASTIEAAVGARGWSAEKATRVAGEDILGRTRSAVDLSEDDLEGALLAGRIVAYAQGFRILQAASESYGLGPRPGARGRDLARGLHHPLGASGRHLGGLPG
jgi:6-phosphogluconate dehydrogenase